MSRDKQIDEMAKIIDDNHGFIVSSVETAEALYDKGYCKAFEVAEKIFAEIETSLQIVDFKGSEVYYAIRAEDYLHYKKKYTESEKDNG